jgi:hypothetical protein
MLTYVMAALLLTWPPTALMMLISRPLSDALN